MEKENFDYREFKEKAISEIKSGKGLSGENNVLLPLIKDLLESAMSAELDIHLDEEKISGIANRRNGKTKKTIKSEQGSFELSTPRDRNSSFMPEIIEKHQTTIDEVFEENILSLYSRGLSYREIQGHLRSLYGTKISLGKLSEITDRILPELNAWQNRGLEPVYSIVWLDALHFNVREEGFVKKKAVYIILGYNLDGQLDILGLYIGGNESSKFWLQILEDIQNRGVQDILIACIDNLTGFTQAIEAVFPKTDVQLCVIHQLRNSLKYVSTPHYKSVVADLKKIYQAINLWTAENAMDEFEQKWAKRYPIVVKSWRTNWHHLTRYFDYSKDIRRIMYTNNRIEGLNRQIRKYTKTRGCFSNDKGLIKLLYVSIKSIQKKWVGKPIYWGQVQQQLLIKFEDRLGVGY